MLKNDLSGNGIHYFCIIIMLLYLCIIIQFIDTILSSLSLKQLINVQSIIIIPMNNSYKINYIILSNK